VEGFANEQFQGLQGGLWGEQAMGKAIGQIRGDGGRSIAKFHSSVVQLQAQKVYKKTE
jgi:hypothetical protein